MFTGFMLKALLILFIKFALSFLNCCEVAFASKTVTKPSVFGSQYTAMIFRQGQRYHFHTLQEKDHQIRLLRQRKPDKGERLIAQN